MEYKISSQKPLKTEFGNYLNNNSTADSTDNNAIYPVKINDSDVGKKLWIRIKTDISKPGGDVDGQYRVDFLQDSETVAYDEMSIKLALMSSSL